METVEPVLQEPWTEGILRCSTKGPHDEEEVVLQGLWSKGPREEKRTLYTNAAQERGGRHRSSPRKELVDYHPKETARMDNRRSDSRRAHRHRSGIVIPSPEEATPKGDNHRN